MVGMRLQPEDSDAAPSRTAPAAAAADLISDDDRSVAADSWSIKSEYGSTLDDEQRHADATEALNAVNCRSAASDYSSDKEEQYEGVSSMLGFQSYWDSAYADELANFRVHGHAGEVWFGADVMESVASWTKSLCTDSRQNQLLNPVGNGNSEPLGLREKDLADWSVLDIGTGNGLLLQEFAKQGFSDLTGTDYSEGAINLARSLADRGGFTNIKFLVDDILETKLDSRFWLVLDKGTLDAIGLHPDGPINRWIMYWDSVSRIVAPGGLLVITSCNSTKDELREEVDTINQRRNAACQQPGSVGNQEAPTEPPPFCYIDHVGTYPTFTFGGSVGSRVATVAFMRN